MTDETDMLSLVHQIDAGTVSILCPDKKSLPEELQGTAPRDVPDWIYECRRIRRPWIASWAAVIVFLSTVALGANPVGSPWAQIAFWSMFIIGMVGVVGLLTTRRDLRFVRHGMVGASRVLSVRLVPHLEHNGQTIGYQHHLDVELETTNGVSMFQEFQGLPIAASERDKVSIGIRHGDQIPVVWLPGEFQKTVTPYAFLAFNADRSLVRDDRGLRTAGAWLKKLGTALLVLLIFVVLFGNLFLFMRCIPVDFSIPVVVTIGVIGGLVLGSLMMAAIVTECRAEDRKAAERNRKAILTGGAIEHGSSHVMLTNTWIGWGYRLVIGSGALLIGGLTVVLWTFGLNIWLDQSPGVDRIITILEVRERNDDRDTEVRFTPVDEPNGNYSRTFARRDLPTVPLFANGTVVVEWHTGRFGWPWVTNFRAVPLEE